MKMNLSDFIKALEAHYLDLDNRKAYVGFEPRPCRPRLPSMIAHLTT